MLNSLHLLFLLSVIAIPFLSRKILCSLMQDLPAMPVLCLCDAQDGERTSILGMEKVKRDLIHYKVTINGPVRSTNEKIQLERLKSEMKYLINQDEVMPVPCESVVEDN